MAEALAWSPEIVQPGDTRAIEAVRALWTDYWRALDLPADFQDFSAELQTLPGKYAPPSGRLLLVRIAGEPAATAAFRRLDARACEAKRLYVHPAYRRRGIAAALLAELIVQARQCGYDSLYGDTLPAMSSALAMYREMGFVEVGPYSESPTPGAIYLRLTL